MKTNLNLKGALCLMFIALLSLSGMAKPLFTEVDASSTVSDTRIITKSFDVNADALVQLLARESEVKVSTWNQNKVEVKVTLFVEAYEKEDMEKMFEEMKVRIDGNKDGVSIKSMLEIKSVIQTGFRQRIKTKHNGTIRVKKYSFSYDVKMPAGNSLNLKNHFGKVELGAHKAGLNLELYECELEAGQLNAQNGVLNLRFSKGTLGKIKNLDLSMYESKVKLNNADQLSINAKFSKLNTGDVNTVNLTAYESKLVMGAIQTLDGNHSFGSLTASDINRLKLTTYELKLEVGNVQKLMLHDSKFSGITIGSVGNFSGHNLYENNVVIGTLETGNVDSKFTNFQIGTLRTSFESRGYETDIAIGTVEKQFSLLKVSGKFCRNTVNLAGGSGFKLIADVSFGSLKYPEDKLERQSYTKRSNGFSMSGRSKGYTGTSIVDFSGYENHLDLNF